MPLSCYYIRDMDIKYLNMTIKNSLQVNTAAGMQNGGYFFES